MKLEHISLQALSALAGNPRKITIEAKERLHDSIVRFGLFRPLLVWGDGCVIGGSQRLAVLQAMHEADALPLRVQLASGTVVEVTEQVPCIRFDGTEAEARTVALRDNHQDGDWDDSLLRDYIGSMDVELKKYTGWDDTELRKLAAKAHGQVDEIVRTPGPADSQVGQLYELGPHRLYCGDSTTDGPWDALDGSYAMVWTDPPYGVEYSSIGRIDQHRPIANDAMTPADLEVFLMSVFERLFARTTKGGVWYVASPSGPAMAAFVVALSRIGVLRHSYCWVKDRMVFGRSDRHYQHETIFYGWKEGKHKWTGGRKRTSVLYFDRPTSSDDHPTMKPVPLIRECLECHGGGVVADPFGGSGSTLIAAHELGLTAHLIELDPVYCDVIRRRWTAVADDSNIDAGPGALR